VPRQVTKKNQTRASSSLEMQKDRVGADPYDLTPEPCKAIAMALQSNLRKDCVE
jgi:hypothetical protein